MALEVSPALPGDMPRLMDIQFSAFGDKDPYHKALYPGGDSASLRASAAERTLKEVAGDPSLQILKCTDPATGTIWGFVKWNVYERDRLASEWQKREAVDWCEGRRKEVAEAFLGATADMRVKIWEGRPHVLCSLICVHENFQRRGAGTLLVQWGMERAAALGVPAYLEASPAGYPLYLKLGFSKIDVVVVKAEMWDGDHDLHFVAMLKDVSDVSSLRVQGELKGA